jgi:hypothetical protein
MRRAGRCSSGQWPQGIRPAATRYVLRGQREHRDHRRRSATAAEDPRLRRTRRLVDSGEPAWLLLVAVLSFLADAEARIVATLRERSRTKILRFSGGSGLAAPGLACVPLWRLDSPADVPGDPS